MDRKCDCNPLFGLVLLMLFILAIATIGTDVIRADVAEVKTVCTQR